jgi:hypothetical protein
MGTQNRRLKMWLWKPACARVGVNTSPSKVPEIADLSVSGA